MEVTKIKLVNKGSFLASCTVMDLPDGMIIHDVMIFEKGSSRWVATPSRTYTGSDGTTKYFRYIDWADSASADKFRDEVLAAFDKEIANPKSDEQALSKGLQATSQAKLSKTTPDKDIPF